MNIRITKRENDAELVLEYYERYLHERNEANKKAYEELEKWFNEKHGCPWAACIKDIGRLK